MLDAERTRRQQHFPCRQPNTYASGRAGALLTGETMSTKRAHTIIEFIDITPHPDAMLLHKTKQVRINGVPVMVAQDGIELEMDTAGNEVTSVTLKLLPTEIHFTAAQDHPGNKYYRPVSNN